MPARVFYFDDLTDRQLLDMIQQNDLQAFDRLYEKYWEPLFNAAYKRLRDAAACEEILQDLFVHLYQVRQQLDISISLGGYLHTALKNRVLNHLRSQKRRIKHSILAARNLPASGNFTSNMVEHNALKKAMDQCLQEMPSQYRDIYLLNRQQQLSVREAALQLGISENRAEKYLQKALAHLRKNLGEFLTAIPILLLLRGK